MQVPRATATPCPSPTAKIDLSGLKGILDAARIKNGVPGMSVAVMYKGEVIFAEGFGKQLVAEGKMDWDETPVNKYLPEFELKDPIVTSQLTMADLLSHRARLSPAVGLLWFRSRTP
ncbi:hypothetical protein BG015_003481 [Linnemannia schmuckeri]|uniref:Beta-lactamase-related domain-containing protein n=1 Tax=Linnemannia schmuckeri TaxID=64567 RepID=A0A9P5RJX4_9FUNG|nr:hypothetical protein BG015_003481 [Linnemannia schmuckeri]